MWDFSAYIFGSQVLIILVMAKIRLIKRRQVFLRKFLIAQIMARLLANNFIKQGWVEFNISMDADCSALTTLLLYIVQKYGTKKQRLRVVLRSFLIFLGTITISELMSERSFQSRYLDIFLTKLYLKEPTFNLLLNLCRNDFHYIDLATLKAYNSLFASKVLIVFMLTLVVSWLKRCKEKGDNSFERIQRAKNSLLEDCLEDKKFTMSELAKIERDNELQYSIDLLKSFEYDYEKYKSECKRRLEIKSKNRPVIERNAFLSEMKKSKNEIHEREEIINDEKYPTNQQIHPSDCFETNPKGESLHKLAQGVVKPIARNWKYFFRIERPEYFYVLLQTSVLVSMAIFILKLKYIVTPFLCVIASTFPPKSLIIRNFNLWVIYTIIVGSCMLNRGIQNMREQYSPYDPKDDKDLQDMLKWIKSDTDKTDAFGGPDDIIALVLLATGRPITNNPLSYHEQMR